MNDLTHKTEKLITHYFPSDRKWAKDQLQSYCAYMAERISDKTSLEPYERFCYAILKLGKTSKSKFLQAIVLGKCDYRDLLVAARFGDSITSHHDWANKILNQGT
jgi:hypothetical protein